MMLLSKKWTIVLGFAALSMQAQKSEPGINTSFMDPKTSPKNDFFRYVNGAWLDATAIPGDQTTWGSFNELRKNTDRDALTILKRTAKDNTLPSQDDRAKAVNLYRTVMDTVARSRAGASPLKPTLAKIAKVKSVTELERLMIDTAPEGGVGFFRADVGPDDKNSTRNIVEVGVGPLGLPDRDYYVSNDKDSQEKRVKYVAHVARMLQFIGEKPADAQRHAERILAFETEMARPRFDRVERRDSRKSYNPMSVDGLQKLVPSINWRQYFDGLGLTGLDSVIVNQPKYMAALQDILKQGKVDDWKAYMRWTALNRAASLLSPQIETANWEFYGRTLTGAIKQRARDERALQVVNGSVGEALGKLYVDEKFPPEAKEKAKAMIQNIIRAYEIRINNLSWMAPETKQNAIAKLKKMTIKIGYPDKWKDYSALTIKSPEEGGTYYDNAKAVARWRFAENIADLKKPVDKTRWGMSPQTVNAYFNPSFNEIVFPAAILQPPFYNYKADEAVNYGGIGAVIGHEISHGFDDSGSRYNADGNLVDWWTEEDSKQFAALTGALADQYSALQPVPGTFVDGKFTLGENIGDLGGVNAAYDGLQLFLKEKGNPGKIDGFTPEQRFFISWATIWRAKSREEALKNQVKTDPHSPAMYRGYVPLQNVDAFYEAFDIKPGDGMYIEPSKRVKIW